MEELKTHNKGNFEFPSHIIELLDSYNSNLSRIEYEALNSVTSTEIAVFNNLRNLTSQECLKALDRLSSKYSRETDLLEYSVCLAVITEYICTAYRNTNLYETFRVSLSNTYKNILFEKLVQRWLQVYRNENLPYYLNNAQFVTSFNILKSSVAQFPTTFEYKYRLRDAIRRGEEMFAKLKSPSCQRNTVEQPSTTTKSSAITPVRKVTQMVKLPNSVAATAMNVPRSFPNTVTGACFIQTLKSQGAVTGVSSPKVSVGEKRPMSDSVQNTSIYSVHKNQATTHSPVLSSENPTVGEELVKNGSKLSSTPSSCKVLQNSTLMNLLVSPVVVDLTKPNDSEPPKKKPRNAFDILMRRTTIPKSTLSVNTSPRVM